MITDALLGAALSVIETLLALLDGFVPEGVAEDLSMGLDVAVRLVPTGLVDELIPLGLLASLIAIRWSFWAVLVVVEFVLWVVDNLPVVGS